MDAQEYQNVAEKLSETLNATVIPVGRNKKPGISGWQHLNQVECLRAANLERFGPEFPSIGIVLGKPSNNLCSIDLDSDELLAEFLACNPKLRGSLISWGNRGGNVWVRIIGPYPKLARIRRGTEACGEWRADGGYTIIWGEHPSGKPYRCSGGMPVEIPFHEIHWPEGFDFKGRPKPQPMNPAPHENQILLEPNSPPSNSSTTTAPLQDCATAPLHDTQAQPVGSRILDEEGGHVPRVTPEQIQRHQEATEAATTQLAREDPRLAKLYPQFMERYEARPRERNAVIVEAVPFLYRAVAEESILPLLLHFYRCHAPLYSASEAEHEREVRAMISGVRTSYLESLSPGERNLYETLNPRIQAIYRICRDLAEPTKPPVEPGTFFMSGDQLELRLGVASKQAHRDLLQLCKKGIMEIAKQGTRRSPGHRGLATTYRWLLPL